MIRLVAVDDGDRFVHVMVRTIHVGDHAALQTLGCGVIFVFCDVVMSLVQKFAGLVQATGPAQVTVNRKVIIRVLSVVNRRLLDFIDGVVDVCNRRALFRTQSPAVRTLQVGPRIPQVRKGVQVSGMLALCVDVLRREREQECNRRSNHSNFSKSFHSDYHLVWNWDG
jgi:hypothetical protein